MADDQTADSSSRRTEAALQANVPEIYFNGFVNTLSIGDVVCVLERNGRPVGVLNMSYTVAKTLSISLGKIVARLEEITERSMLTTHDIEASLKSAEEEKKK